MAKSTEITAVRFPGGETHAYCEVWQDALARGLATPLYGMAGVEAVREWQRSRLLEIVQPGAYLTVVTTHRSARSGPTRFRVFVAAVDANGMPYVREITGPVAEFVGFRRHGRTGAIIVAGYGFNKAFHIADSLGCALWPDGTPEPHGTRNGEPDRFGGYALKVN